MSARRLAPPLLALAVAGCSAHGTAVDLAVHLGCRAANAATVEIDAIPTPGGDAGALQRTEPAGPFLGGMRHIGILPPDDATAIDVTVRALDGDGRELARGDLHVALTAGEVTSLPLAVGGDDCGDGAAVADLAADDLASGDGGPSDGAPGDGGVIADAPPFDLARPDLVLLPAPTLTAIAAARGPTAGGTTVTLTGTHFLAAATVTFDGHPASGVTVASPTTITATLPAAPGQAGPATVVVTNPDGQAASRADLFAYFASTLRFIAPDDLPLPGDTAVAVAADFDGDGHPDVAAPEPYAQNGTIAIALNDGSGRFGSWRRVIAGVATPSWLVAGDWDGDKKADLAVGSQTADDVAILLGRGDGTFQAARVVYTGPGTGVLYLAAGDVDGDARSDLVLDETPTGDGGVGAGRALALVAAHDGSATFTAATPVTTGGGPARLALADLDGDRRLDLVVPCAGAGQLDVFLGNGDGTFAAPTTTAVAGAHDVAIGDFDKKLGLDVAVASSTAGNMTVLLNQGSSGLLAPASSYAIGLSPDGIAAGDFDGDGTLDLAGAASASTSVADGRIVVYRGAAGGTFQPAGAIPVNLPSTLTAIDVDGDGRADLVTALDPTLYPNEYGGVAIARSRGATGGLAIPPVTASPTITSAAALGDLDGDGKLDAITANYVSYGGGFATYHGNGDGTFAAAKTNPIGGVREQGDLALADFDGDGKLDVAITDLNNGVADVLLNAGGTFTLKTAIPGEKPAPNMISGAIAAADFDGDGKQDLAFTLSETTVVHWGNGDGTFDPSGKPPVTLASNGYTTHVLAVDLDGKNGPDLIQGLVGGVIGGRPLVAILNQGGGTFATPVVTQVNDPISGAPVWDLATGDFDGDGKLDVATTCASTSAPYPSHVDILLGVGDGHFNPAGGYTVGQYAFDLAAGDFDLDGAIDLAAVGGEDSSLTILRGAGDGTFTVGPIHATAIAPGAIAVGRIDGDLLPDLLLAFAPDASHGGIETLVNLSR